MSEKKMSDKRMNSLFGWLSPKGYFVHCEYAQHHAMASRLRGKSPYLSPMGRHSKYKREEELQELGWIKISSGIPLFNRKNSIGEHLVTQRQYNFLVQYSHQHSINDPYPYTVLRITESVNEQK